MLDGNIIQALIVAGFALVGTVVSAKYISNVRVVRLEMRLEQLEYKVNKHNNLVERTYRLERELALVNQKNDHHHV